MLAPVDALGATAVRGQGSCKQWLQSRVLHEDPYFRGWVLGFLSGTANAMQSDVLAATPAAALYESIDERCRANPAQDLDDAAEAVFIELMMERAHAGIR